MKLILSRKGFDSAAGGAPNPILPSGRMCMLPIPDEPSRARAPRYDQITVDGASIGAMVEDLTRGRVAASSRAHLDPDLLRESLPRAPGWRPVFGQSGAAERHLRNQGVDAGDLFLFFGWFRHIDARDGRFRYLPPRSGFHALLGWLQIERRIPHDRLISAPPWAADHPHCDPQRAIDPDAIYISRRQLDIPGMPDGLPGGGCFPWFTEALRLSAPGTRRSRWRLPRWFAPRTTTLSYHGDPRRWTVEADHVELQTVGRGQEYVLDAAGYPECLDWLAALLDPYVEALRRDAKDHLTDCERAR